MNDLPVTIITRKNGRSTQNAVSPFRYPGGKGFFTEFLSKYIEDLGLSQSIHFVEPFCGGAGAALNLLADNYVSHVHLNDADIRIYSAWRAMLFESERFVENIFSVPLTMNEWYSRRELVENANVDAYSFDLGFSTFFMNRTTRSGIVLNAGPIGGYSQNGKWKIDARFNRERLSKQVCWLANNRDRISIINRDALSFISHIKRTAETSNMLFFIDPPYVKAGGRLYLNAMSEAKHIALADILVSGIVPYWVLTYDDAPLIRELYKSVGISKISVNYSLQNKRKESELLVVPN